MSSKKSSKRNSINSRSSIESILDLYFNENSTGSSKSKKSSQSTLRNRTSSSKKTIVSPKKVSNGSKNKKSPDLLAMAFEESQTNKFAINKYGRELYNDTVRLKNIEKILKEEQESMSKEKLAKLLKEQDELIIDIEYKTNRKHSLIEKEKERRKTSKENKGKAKDTGKNNDKKQEPNDNEVSGSKPSLLKRAATQIRKIVKK